MQLKLDSLSRHVAPIWTRLEHVLSLLDNIVEKIAMGSLLVSVVIVGLQVFLRYILNYAAYWTEELARVFFIWIALLGSVVALGRNSHLGVDFLVKRLPPNVEISVACLGNALVLLFLAALFKDGIYMVREHVSSLLPSLEIPKTVMYLPVPIAAALMFLRVLSNTLRLSKRV